MSSFLEKLSEDSAGAVLAIASMLLAMVIGYLISRLALYASMRRIGWPSREFSPNPASVMIGLLLVPLALFIYLIATDSQTLTIDDFLFCLELACTMTAPILFALGPVFFVYACNMGCGKEMTDRSAYALVSLCVAGQVLWLMMLLSSTE